MSYNNWLESMLNVTRLLILTVLVAFFLGMCHSAGVTPAQVLHYILFIVRSLIY